MNFFSARQWLASGPVGFWLFLALTFLGAIIWAKSNDPLERVWFTLSTPAVGEVKGVAVLPKPVQRLPIVFYVYGAGGSVINSGDVLRQLATLGMAAVALEYNPTNSLAFEEQFLALRSYIFKQPWADTNAIAWIGFSRGAQQTLEFLLNRPEAQPHVYVRVAGGLLPDVQDKLSKLNVPISTKVILVHGEQDEIFPATDTLRLAEYLKFTGVAVTAMLLPEQRHTFSENRRLVFRNIGEFLKKLLDPRHPTPVSPTPAGYPLSLCLSASVLWAACWLYLRRRLGRLESPVHPPPTCRVSIIRCTAVVLAIWASAETVLHLVIPSLRVSKNTLALARWKLISPRWTEDFDALAGEPYWRNHRLRTLLSHVELSNYCVYQLINWKLDKRLYTEHVLSPVIDAETDPELNWRRPLWEFFFPRIRKENYTSSAAEIVVRELRQRITIDPVFDYSAGIESIWKNQIATPAGFERIYVAALRSVGVPAKLNTDRKAEYWTGSEWKPAPRPLIEAL